MRYVLSALAGFVCVLGVHAGCSASDSQASNGSGGFTPGVGGSAGAAGSATAGSAGSDNSGGSGAGASSSGGAGAGTSTGGSGAGASSSGGSSGSSSGSGGSTGVKDAGLPDVSFTYDAPVIEEDACAATRVTADPVPVSVYIMLDRSCSMGGQRLTDAKQAINAFVNDADSAGLGVAFDIFPEGGNDCQTSTYSNPTVGMGTLPTNAAPISSAVNAVSASGGTPTAGALRGATVFCNDYQTATGIRCVPILISDGFPESNDCSSSDNSAAALGGISSMALSNWNVTTFAMGLSGLNAAGWNVLHTIAQQGGSDCDGNPGNTEYACDASAGSQAFIDALNAIRDAVLSCDFTMPQPAGGVPDIDNVNVLFTPSGGGAVQSFNKVNDVNGCAGTEGWYYDNNVTPTQISLCPAACSKVQADSTGEINIELPCEGS